jgi:hypothetical protein
MAIPLCRLPRPMGLYSHLMISLSRTASDGIIGFAPFQIGLLAPPVCLGAPFLANPTLLYVKADPPK